MSSTIRDSSTEEAGTGNFQAGQKLMIELDPTVLASISNEMPFSFQNRPLSTIRGLKVSLSPTSIPGNHEGPITFPSRDPRSAQQLDSYAEVVWGNEQLCHFRALLSLPVESFREIKLGTKQYSLDSPDHKAKKYPDVLPQGQGDFNPFVSAQSVQIQIDSESHDNKLNWLGPASDMVHGKYLKLHNSGKGTFRSDWSLGGVQVTVLEANYYSDFSNVRKRTFDPSGSKTMASMFGRVEIEDDSARRFLQSARLPMPSHDTDTIYVPLERRVHLLFLWLVGNADSLQAPWIETFTYEDMLNDPQLAQTIGRLGL